MLCPLLLTGDVHNCCSFCCSSINATVNNWERIKYWAYLLLKDDNNVKFDDWKEWRSFLTTESPFCAPSHHQDQNILLYLSREKPGLSSVLQLQQHCLFLHWQGWGWPWVPSCCSHHKFGEGGILSILLQQGIGEEWSAGNTTSFEWMILQVWLTAIP